MRTYIGCSGYYYREWKGLFYPQELPSTKWLPYYATQFNTLEINSTFYKTPTEKSLAKWYNSTPDDFIFTVKANKLFTHYRRLNNIVQELEDFHATITNALREKLHCVLWQFPASVKYTPEMLQQIIGNIHPRQYVQAIELRDEGWWRAEVFETLHSAGLSFVNISLPGFPDIPVAATGGSAYYRFHGKPELYKSAYGKNGLQLWAQHALSQEAAETFIYFNNTWYGNAIEDARIFRQLINR